MKPISNSPENPPPRGSRGTAAAAFAVAVLLLLLSGAGTGQEVTRYHFTAARGCVDCHFDDKRLGKDFRLSRTLARWASEGVPDELLEYAQKAAPAGVKLTGRHPDVNEKLRDAVIPDVCIQCHAENSDRAPEFKRLIHLLKYQRSRPGRGNHFHSVYGGYCIYCHQLEPETGRWRIKSGLELDTPPP